MVSQSNTSIGSVSKVGTGKRHQGTDTIISVSTKVGSTKLSFKDSSERWSLYNQPTSAHKDPV
jgi:hypothetical protein